MNNYVQKYYDSKLCSDIVYEVINELPVFNEPILTSRSTYTYHSPNPFAEQEHYLGSDYSNFNSNQQSKVNTNYSNKFMSPNTNHLSVNSSKKLFNHNLNATNQLKSQSDNHLAPLIGNPLLNTTTLTNNSVKSQLSQGLDDIVKLGFNNKFYYKIFQHKYFVLDVDCHDETESLIGPIKRIVTYFGGIFSTEVTDKTKFYIYEDTFTTNLTNSNFLKCKGMKVKMIEWQMFLMYLDELKIEINDNKSENVNTKKQNYYNMSYSFNTNNLFDNSTATYRKESKEFNLTRNNNINKFNSNSPPSYVHSPIRDDVEYHDPKTIEEEPLYYTAQYSDNIYEENLNKVVNIKQELNSININKKYSTNPNSPPNYPQTSLSPSKSHTKSPDYMKYSLNSLDFDYSVDNSKHMKTGKKDKKIDRKELSYLSNDHLEQHIDHLEYNQYNNINNYKDKSRHFLSAFYQSLNTVRLMNNTIKSIKSYMHQLNEDNNQRVNKIIQLFTMKTQELVKQKTNLIKSNNKIMLELADTKTQLFDIKQLNNNLSNTIESQNNEIISLRNKLNNNSMIADQTIVNKYEIKVIENEKLKDRIRELDNIIEVSNSEMHNYMGMIDQLKSSYDKVIAEKDAKIDLMSNKKYSEQIYDSNSRDRSYTTNYKDMTKTDMTHRDLSTYRSLHSVDENNYNNNHINNMYKKKQNLKIDMPSKNNISLFNSDAYKNICENINSFESRYNPELFNIDEYV